MGGAYVSYHHGEVDSVEKLGVPKHIVSFVLEEGTLVIPDEGYHFPWSPDLEEKVDALLDPSGAFLDRPAGTSHY